MATMGRPTSYNEKYIEEILTYFNQPLYILKEKEVASGGRMVKIKEEKPNSMPTFEGFALSFQI
jgi:hypothetical protein